MASAIATRYASALVHAVLAPDSGVDPRHTATELHAFEALVRESVELRNVLISPAVSIAKKRAVAGRFADTLGVSRLVRNFLFVLLDHRRAGILSQIAEAFDTVVDERMGVVRAQVTAAAPMTGDQQQQLQNELSRVAGKRVRCEFSINPELIGGVVARIGSTVYDGSVRSQLQGLRERLLTA